jgi:tetratricopeptide (TPR) repeat protein
VRRSARIFYLTVFTLFVVLASTTQAQNKASKKPSAEETARAREAYKSGQKYFEAEQYEEAEVSFREAYAAVPNPIVLLSVAECQKRAGKNEEAVATFESYLEAKPDAKDRAEVEVKIEEIKSLPATLVITTDPPGAKISIDGSDSGKVSPAEVEIAPGEHTVELTLDSGESVTKSLQAGFGARHELVVDIGSADLVDPFAASDGQDVYGAEPEPQKDDTGGSSVAPWIVISVGGAALAAGTVLGVMALSEESDFNENPNTDSADRGEQLALFADVAFGVGAVAVITGVVLLLTEGEPAAEDDSAAAGNTKGPRVMAAPVLHRDGGGFAASVRF